MNQIKFLDEEFTDIILIYEEFYRYNSSTDEEVDDFRYVNKENNIRIPSGRVTYSDEYGNTNWDECGCCPVYITLDVTDQELEIIKTLADNAGVKYEIL